jgi:hypothetical protein
MPTICRRVKVQSTTIRAMITALIVRPRPVPLRPFVVKKWFQNLPLNFYQNPSTCVRDFNIETVRRSFSGKVQGSPVGIESIALLIRFARTCLISPPCKRLAARCRATGAHRYVRNAQRALKEGQRGFEEHWNRNRSRGTLLSIEFQGMRRDGRDPIQLLLSGRKILTLCVPHSSESMR